MVFPFVAASLALAGSLLWGSRPTVDDSDQFPTPAEFAARMGLCLDERGADWTLSADGESVTVINQGDVYSDCLRELDELGLVRSEDDLSSDELGEIFDHASRARQCLEDLGHSVPEMPDRRAFIDGNAELPQLFDGIPGQAIMTCMDATR